MVGSGNWRRAARARYEVELYVTAGWELGDENMAWRVQSEVECFVQRRTGCQGGRRPRALPLRSGPGGGSVRLYDERADGGEFRQRRFFVQNMTY